MARVSLQLIALFVVVAAHTVVDAAAAALPFVHAGGPEATVPLGATWSAQVGNKVFYHDGSHDPSHYYYAAGRESGLTELLQDRRVGNDGRWHVFHLPEGPAALAQQLPGPSSGSRHTAFSNLLQLKAGQVLPAVFPSYGLSADYQQPGSTAAHGLEREAVAKLTPKFFNDTLLEVTSIEDGASCTRSHTNPNATAHAIGFITNKFKALGMRTCLQWFGQYTNVIAYMPGTTRDTLTVGAHYDSRPFDGPAPGANDNGSGVAGLLALARVFMEARVQPKKDLFFVAFAAEEPGLWGSEAYVKALRGEAGADELPADCRPPAASFLQAARAATRARPIGSPVSLMQSLAIARKEAKHAALILDEVGWKSPFHPGEVPHMQLESRDGSNEVMTHVAESNRLHNVDNGESKLVVTHSTNPFGSDHMPFINRNLEGVLIINGDDDRYPSYHSSGDVMANVDPEYASTLLKAVAGGLFRLAGSASEKAV